MAGRYGIAVPETVDQLVTQEDAIGGRGAEEAGGVVGSRDGERSNPISGINYLLEGESVAM